MTDGGRFSGTATPALSITGTLPADTGTYTLTVTNALGEAAATPVFILVRARPADRAPTFADLASGSPVSAFLPLPEGRMLIAGDGPLSQGAASSLPAALAIAHPDGTVANLGLVPGTTNALPQVTGRILDLVRQPDGKLIIAGTFTSVNGVPANQRGPADDPDSDGIANLLEYALGLAPATPDSAGLPIAAVIGGDLTLTCTRADPAALTYLVETTTDLATPASWTATGVTQGTPAADGLTTATVPLGTGPRFLRLRVTLLPSSPSRKRRASARPRSSLRA